MELQKAIRQLYQAFETAPLPEKIILFRCVSCLGLADERYLLSTPRAALNDHIFGSIMEACNTIPMGDQCYKYYIPRILELTTSEDPDFSFPFVEYVYRDFAKFDYQNKFSQDEKLAIDGFFDAYLLHEMMRPSDELDVAVLFEVAEAGYNPLPLLDSLQAQENWSSLHTLFMEHLDIVARQYHKEKEGFAAWCQKGTRQAVISYLNSDN